MLLLAVKLLLLTWLALDGPRIGQRQRTQKQRITKQCVLS
jgi:hypothetical protein